MKKMIAVSVFFFCMAWSGAFSDPIASLSFENRGPAIGHPDLPSPEKITLSNCILMALSNNRTVLQSKASSAVAKAKRDQLWKAQLPNAALQVSKVKYKEALNPFLSSEQDVSRLVVTQTIQPFGRYDSQKKAAIFSIQSSDEAERKTEIEISFQAVKTFYDLLLARHLEEVASESVSQLQRHRDLTETLVNAGANPKFDLLRAEVQLSTAKPILIKATHARSTGLADLLNLLGLDPSAQPEMVGTFPEDIINIPVPDEKKALEIALKNRPDVSSAKAAVEAAKNQLTAVKQSLQPALQFSGYAERSRGARLPVDDHLSNIEVQASLNYPFMDSGLTDAQAREARANLQISTLAYQNTVSTLLADIRKAISGVEEARETLHSQEKNVEQALEALAIAEKAYEAGTMTILDYLDAQLALTQAKTLRFQGLHDHAVAIAALERSLGKMPGTLIDKQKGSSTEIVVGGNQKSNSNN
ncbi:MAG: TolC family protein [Candidatus Riflebacteria bacterium]|nr:TolC family protein [Candidatus Riflebacteria bacterium]